MQYQQEIFIGYEVYRKHLGQHISPVDEAALCSLKEQNTAREDIHSLYGFNSTIQSLLAYILCCYIGQEFSRGEGCGDKRCFLFCFSLA